MEAVTVAVMAEAMEVATAVVIMAAVTTAVGIVVAEVMATLISAADIMAAAIFTAGRRISVHSPDIARFPRNA